MKRKAFKAALPYTLPICVGFLFLGMSYGFLMRSKGFSFVYPMFMSLFIFAGSMEFVTVELLLEKALSDLWDVRRILYDQLHRDAAPGCGQGMVHALCDAAQSDVLGRGRDHGSPSGLCYPF